MRCRDWVVSVGRLRALLDLALGRERPRASVPEPPATESTPRVKDSRTRQSAPTEINAMLERVLARHHSLLKKQGVRIRVLLGHRRDLVAMSGRTLFDCLSALLAHGLTALDEDSEAVLRTRDVAGLMCLELIRGSLPRADPRPRARGDPLPAQL